MEMPADKKIKQYVIVWKDGRATFSPHVPLDTRKVVAVFDCVSALPLDRLSHIPFKPVEVSEFKGDVTIQCVEHDKPSLHSFFNTWITRLFRNPKFCVEASNNAEFRRYSKDQLKAISANLKSL